jgi:hypothetical protein
VRPTYAEVDSHGKRLPEYRTEVRSRWTKQISPSSSFRTEGPPEDAKEVIRHSPMSNTFHVPERFVFSGS